MTHISILTSTIFATSESPSPLTYVWIGGQTVYFFHLSTNKRRVMKTDPTGPSVQQWIGHHSWLLYQLVVRVMGSSLPPRQWLLYFPTCQVNICEQALALEAVCSSHSCDCSSEMLLRSEAALVGTRSKAGTGVITEYVSSLWGVWWKSKRCHWGLLVLIDRHS